MHVGNCTDEPAEYKTSTSSGSPQAPLELGVWYSLDPHSYNIITFLGQLDVQFRVGSQTLSPLTDLSSDDDAILVECDGDLSAHSLSLASLVQGT